MALHETLARILNLQVYKINHEPFAVAEIPKRLLFVGKVTRNVATLEGLAEKYGVEITLVVPEDGSNAVHTEMRSAESLMSQLPTRIKLAIVAKDLSGVDTNDYDAVFIDIMDDALRAPFTEECWRVIREGGWNAIRANLKSPLRLFKDLGMLDVKSIKEESVWYGRVRKDESIHHPKARK